MNDKLKITMYQSISALENETSLNTIYAITKEKLDQRYLSKKSKYVKAFILTNLIAHPPGNLKDKLSDDCISKSEIGSISVNLLFNKSYKINFLLFKKKMKTSGSICQELNDKLKNSNKMDKILKSYVYEINSVFLQFIDKSIHLNNVDIFCINALMSYDRYIEDFITFCKTNLEKNEDFYKVIMPLTSSKGRISATKVYPMKNSRCSAHFDGKGKIQFFGFVSVECLYVFSEMIRSILLK
jgi:hypothetical protein